MRRCLAPLIALLTCSSPLFAQQPKVLAPHRPVPPQVTNPRKWHKPAVLRSMVGGLWTTDANFKSSIYLRNDVETDPITVTPILWLSNGRRYALNDVKLEAAGVAVVNINQALADKGIASWATLTGYVEIQYTWPWDALCVTVWNVDAAHSLIFTYGLHPSSPLGAQAAAAPGSAQSQILQGLWWKQEANVSGFVALSNTSSEPIHASIGVSDAAGTAIGEHSVTVSSHGTKLVNMPELQVNTASAGGVSIAYKGPADALILNGGLQDQAVGYSAMIPFAAPPEPSTKPSAESYAELGLMTGAADPMMLFPAGTTFAPYSIVRNVSDQPIQVSPTLWWMAGAAPRSAPLRPITVLPGQAQNLDLPALLVAAGLKDFNGSVNLALDLQGPPRGLLMSSGSVDQKNTYVFGVVASGVQEGVAKSLSYWSIANGDDTMVTLWNPADESQDFALTLFFTGGHYDLPIHLGPRATNTLNISEIVRSQIPDAEGNVVPLSVHEGSARIAGTHGPADHILVAMAAGTYNVVKATCGEHCQSCNGTSSEDIEDIPVDMAVGGTDTLKFIVTLKDGSQYDFTASSKWSTNNTSIATVQSAGVIKGVAVGNYTTSVIGPNVPTGTQCCSFSGQCSCPEVPTIASGGGTVQVPTYFGPTGYAVADGMCEAGWTGTFINVSDQVLDQYGNAMQIGGITPQELVCRVGSCQPGYNTFSTPPSTTAAGTFNDVPIGTCFQAPIGNECVAVNVIYQAYIFGPTNTYPISTASNRLDCVKGEKDQILGNSAGYNQTYITGTLP